MDAEIYPKFHEYGRGIEFKLRWEVEYSRDGIEEEDEVLLEIYEGVDQLFDENLILFYLFDLYKGIGITLLEV